MEFHVGCEAVQDAQYQDLCKEVVWGVSSVACGPITAGGVTA